MIEIPEELLELHRAVTLSMDGLTVNGLVFLTSIAHELYYRTAQYVQSTSEQAFKQAFKEIQTNYHKGGFQVEEVHCDGEFRQL